MASGFCEFYFSQRVGFHVGVYHWYLTHACCSKQSAVWLSSVAKGYCVGVRQGGLQFQKGQVVIWEALSVAEIGHMISMRITESKLSCKCVRLKENFLMQFDLTLTLDDRWPARLNAFLPDALCSKNLPRAQTLCQLKTLSLCYLHLPKYISLSDHNMHRHNELRAFLQRVVLISKLRAGYCRKAATHAVARPWATLNRQSSKFYEFWLSLNFANCLFLRVVFCCELSLPQRFTYYVVF